MELKRAKEVLEDSGINLIVPDKDAIVEVHGIFTADQLEAIATWMRSEGVTKA